MLRHNNWLKISHHRHTFRLRPHEYTSYLPLGALLVVVGVVLALGSAYALTEAGSTGNPPPPIAQSVSLTGTMPGNPPKTAAVITSPSDQSHMPDSPITISGTCPASTLVEIYDNDIFAGSTPCNGGNFSLKVGLLFGQNQLVARVYNAVNEAGPDSSTVTAFYSVLPSQGAGLAPLDLSGSQLILNTSAVFRGSFPGESMNVPVSIIGGTPPYALNIVWGDATNQVISRNNNLPFSEDHTYQKPGTFQISLEATDAKGRVAFLTVAAIINGQPAIAAAGSSSGTGGGTSAKLIDLWPLWTASVAIVVSFWLGERREKRLITAHPSLILHRSS